MNQKNSKAVVLLSGGQDSTTCLAWAKKEFKHVSCLSFDYGQRHQIELESAKKIAEITNTSLKIQKISFFKELKNNALTNKELKITKGNQNSLPSTFVPGRNLIFLSIAASYAAEHNCSDLITGVCQTDFSGYPDCRDVFIKSLEQTISLALDQKFKIHTPLMFLTKAETVKLMEKLQQLELLKFTHSCYKGERRACGLCPACELRLKGFKNAGLKDPIKYTHHG